MTQKAKRGILELNPFQLSVLKPFYVACFLSVIFFVAMCYGLFFFPDTQAVERVLITQCPNSVSPYWVWLSLLSLICSVIALILLNRRADQPSGNVSRDTQKKKISPDNDSILLILLMGTALLISVAVILFSLYQYFDLEDLVPAVNFRSLPIQPRNMIVLAAAVATMASIFALFYWAYRITNKVLGPYERILRELDKVVDGRSRRALTVRDGDEMFAQLIERINVLMKQREPKKDKDVS